MSTKHTPGPWVIVEEGEGYKQFSGDIVIGDEPEGWCIAVALADVSNIPTKANANLICAAPDLLEALRLHDTGCLVMDPEPDCDCYGCRTRAAIAKAEGTS